jgi:hypothetical protein
MGLSVTGKNSILSALCGKANYVNLASVCYIGLMNSEGVEPTAATTGYARQLLGNYAQSDSQAMGTAADGTITNAKAISFPVADANWDVTVTQFGLFTSATGGTPIFTGALTTSVSVLKDYIATFVPSSLTISVT